MPDHPFWPKMPTQSEAPSAQQVRMLTKDELIDAIKAPGYSTRTATEIAGAIIASLAGLTIPASGKLEE